MSITRDDLLIEKKARYQKLREELWYGAGKIRGVDTAVAFELQVIMMEINYLEQHENATPDEIAFMAPERND